MPGSAQLQKACLCNVVSRTNKDGLPRCSPRLTNVAGQVPKQVARWPDSAEHCCPTMPALNALLMLGTLKAGTSSLQRIVHNFLYGLEPKPSAIQSMHQITEVTLEWACRTLILASYHAPLPYLKRCSPRSVWQSNKLYCRGAFSALPLQCSKIPGVYAHVNIIFIPAAYFVFIHISDVECASLTLEIVDRKLSCG